MVARVIDHPFPTGVIPTPYNPDPALLAIVEIIRDGLVRDQHVRLHNFGTFRLRWSKERQIKHPGTGEIMTVAPAPKVTFTPAKHLREMVDPDRQPSIPLDKSTIDAPVKTLSETKVSNINSYTRPNHGLRSDEQKNAGEFPDLKENIQDIIDEKYNPPEENITFFRYHKDSKTESDHRPSKKWALGLLAAVPLILVLLQADFTTGSNNISENLSKSGQNHLSGKTTRSAAVQNKQELISGHSVIREKSVTKTVLPSDINHNEINKSASLVPAPAVSATGSFYMTPQTHTIQRGENLWNLAQRFYGDALLWPHIYRANRRTVADPDHIVIGKKLVIPGLQQSPDNLSSKDKKLIAEGYYQVYQFHKTRDYRQSVYFLITAGQYNFKWLLQMKPHIPGNDWSTLEKSIPLKQ